MTDAFLYRKKYLGVNTSQTLYKCGIPTVMKINSNIPLYPIKDRGKSLRKISATNCLYRKVHLFVAS